MTTSTNQLAQQYQKKTDKQHILDNPDTYIGSIENVDANLWVFDEETNSLKLKTIEYIPGLYKLFDEGIVNCRDHVIRMIQSKSEDRKNVSYINIDIKDDVITMENDGNGIDIAKHPEYNIWIPEMVFGHLRTSTNYNKEEKKIVGGKNGFGFKLVLIWSSYGRIETVDHIRGLKYVQEFKNNLDVICPPVITKVKSTKPYTKISFKPDYTRLGISGLTEDMMALIKKRIYDVGAVTDHSAKKIKVVFNDNTIPVKNFQQYIDLYIGGKGEEKRVYEMADERWEYAVALSPTHEFVQISFVNGICTFKGGKHVDYILGQIVRKLCAYIEKKKKVAVNPNTVKEQLFLFIRCDVENPSFDSQTKDFMNTPSNKFGSSCTVSDVFIEKVAKMGVMDLACAVTEAKESRIAKKTDGTKSRTVRGIANFIDANQSGTENSKDCILILCEGLSALSGIVSGLSSEDRNLIGIYPLKGKLLNVRGENVKKISENKEITDLKKILGLETGKKYNTIADVNKSLRYGKVMFMTDQDSVVADTPLLLRNTKGLLEIKTIDEIHKEEWETQINGKEISTTDYEIWTETGWTYINKVIRHKVNKRIFRVLTHTACVDVTEDHSLVKNNKEEISPKDLSVNDLLLHSFPNFYETEYSIDYIKTMNVTEIRGIAKELKIRFYCAKNRDELLEEIDAIISNGKCEIGKNFNITQEEAYVMGLFWADGTCGFYECDVVRKPINRPNEYTFHRKAYNWSIVNTNLDYLTKAKEYIEKIYDYEFKIIECSMGKLKWAKSDVIYKLLIMGDVETLAIVEKYRNLFYDKNKNKRIPMEILNSPKIIREQFFEGYYDGDGCKTRLEKCGLRTFDINGQIGSHGMYLLSKSIGYEVSININVKKPKIYTFTLTKGTQQDNPIRVKKIIDLGVTEQYVYDLETENHHFQAGVGQLIVHNTDGSHIKGLCINLFHSEWSSLIKITGFLSFMNTPILRAKKGLQSQLFYNEGEYLNWKENTNTAGWTIKYFKGLGTSTASEFKGYFADKKIVDFVYTGEESDNIIDKVFNKKRADDRKIWLEKYDKNSFVDTKEQKISYTQFVDQELIHFSKYDCARSIPNMVDGLKTSQRKIIYCAFKRNLTTELKVAQFSGYVSEHSAYHHGENSLNGAIIAMAQNFVGSNNINLLEPNGQFGTRLTADDSASERYIFTLLNPLTRYIFPQHDDSVLTYLDDDGTMVEPEYYVPIIPFTLVNGISGIGTGFSCNIPSYNPLEIVLYLQTKLAGTVTTSTKDMEFVPYYEGFKGTIRKIEEYKYLIRGKYEKVGDDKIHITELPVGTWTMPYTTFLESLMDGTAVDKAGKKIPPTIKDFASTSTEIHVNFVVTFPKGKIQELEQQTDANGCNGIEKTLKLMTTISTTNMHLFDSEFKLHKYNSVNEIIDAFYEVRMDTYQKRKLNLIDVLENRLIKLSNRARYIQGNLSGKIDLRRKTHDVVMSLLKEMNFQQIDGDYKYLVKMPMDSVTEENVKQIMQEKENAETELSELRNTTLTQMWSKELDAFSVEYKKYKQLREVIQAGTMTSNKSKNVTKNVVKRVIKK
jgi:DNA gyrase/topoisomerase IV subunit B